MLKENNYFKKNISFQYLTLHESITWIHECFQKSIRKFFSRVPKKFCLKNNCNIFCSYAKAAKFQTHRDNLISRDKLRCMTSDVSKGLRESSSAWSEDFVRSRHFKTNWSNARRRQIDLCRKILFAALQQERAFQGPNELHSSAHLKLQKS